jgi:protein O-mannosyl-transferase
MTSTKDSQAPCSTFTRPFPGVLVLLLVTVAVFYSSLEHQFLNNWDDYLYVVKNPAAHGFSSEHLKDAFTKFYVGNYAPLHIVSYMFDYTLWGLNPAGFIGTNIMLHAMNGLIFYLIVLRVTSDSRLAFFSAFIFLVHPVQVESVVWISQRKNLLAMFFFLVALFCYLNYRGKSARDGVTSYCAALAFFLCALLTKSVTVIFPLVVVLYDLCLVPRESRGRWLLDKVPFFAVAAIIALVTLKSQAASQGGGMVDYPDQSAWDLFLTMLTVFARYAGLLVWPARLSIDYAPPIKNGIDLSVALSGLLMMLGCYGLFRLYRTRRSLFFWAALIPVGLLPVSQIIPLTTLMNDRYLYFPLLGAAVLFAWVAVFCIDKLHLKHRALPVIICLALLPLPALSWQRSQVWSDSLSLWSDALDKYPSFETYAGMGNALYQADRIDEAVAMYRKSLLLEPTCEEALRSMGAIYLNRGDYTRARYYIEQFVTLYPDNAFGRTMLELAYGQNRQPRP